MLFDDDEDSNLSELNWIGRLFAFAQATNTRMLALVGDPDVTSYEILFSFDNPRSRRQFTALVRDDGYVDPDEQATFAVPTIDEIRDARPIGRVFPEHQLSIILGVGLITLQGLATDASNSDA